MKKDLHPTEYRTVVIQDTSDGSSFLTKSSAQTDETIKWEDGNEYPLVKVHISSSSHPFYTGKEKLVDIEGRVDKFKARREAGEKRRAELKKKASPKSKKPTDKKEEEVVKIGDGSKPKLEVKTEDKSEETAEAKEESKES